MKLKAVILVIIAAALLFACYPLVAPIQPRTNPNDENSILPVAEPDSFTAVYNGEVNLSWIPIEATGEQRRDGYLVIRKVGSAPTNVLDGTFAGAFGPMDNGSGYSDFVDDGSDGDFDEGVPAGYVSYYGLFAYYTEEEDPPSVTNTDESGNLTDTDYYIFAGPLTASVSVPRTVQLDITEDCYIDEFSDWDFEGFALYTGYDWMTTTEPTYISIIVFDTSSLSNAVISEASFTLTNSNSFTGESPRVDMITEDWDSSYNFSQVQEEAFGSTTYSFTFDVVNTGGGDSNTVSDALLVDIVQKWADGTPNYGLRIMNDMGASDFTNLFNASESGVDVNPVLEVTYTMQ